MTPDPKLISRVTAMAGPVTSWRPAHGGYTPAERWIARLRDGSSVFVKAATSPLTAEWLRAERKSYESIHGPFMARMVGFEDDDERPVLLLEDLSAGHWPPPWRPGDIERVRETLEMVAATPAPGWCRTVESFRADLARWDRVADDPGSFLALGLCSAGWLDRALPVLIDAGRRVILEGDGLLHFDTRSDNICLLEDRVVLVDWNGPCVGNSKMDLAFWLPSLRLEAGPLPEANVADDEGFAALCSGFWADRARLPPIPDAPHVRRIQLRQLRIALPWAARSLGLPPPDGGWAQQQCEAAADAYRSGRLNESAYTAAVEEALGDAYLSTDDPRGGSGKSGDETEWRWAREFALDALPSGGRRVIDVGCANGYLMESFHRWGAERGVAVEPFGVDISWRLVTEARRRLPQWADRIWEADALRWIPPMRFDLVHAHPDAAPPGRERDFIAHLLGHYVAPDGRLVFRAGRAGPDEPDWARAVRTWGFDVGGILEAAHPRTGDVRRTVWLSAPRP